MLYVKKTIELICRLVIKKLTKEQLDEIYSYKRNCNIHKNTKIYAPFFLDRVEVGMGSYLSGNSHVSFTKIGKFCSIGPNLSCGHGIHPLNGISTSPIFYSTSQQAGFTYADRNLLEERKKIKIGNDVFIGMNVTILDGVTIGDGAVIGAGAVVSKDIPPYAIAVGCPIKIIKYRFSHERIEKMLELKWWDWNEKEIEKLSESFYSIDEIIENNE